MGLQQGTVLDKQTLPKRSTHQALAEGCLAGGQEGQSQDEPHPAACCSEVLLHPSTCRQTQHPP